MKSTIELNPNSNTVNYLKYIGKLIQIKLLKEVKLIEILSHVFSPGGLIETVLTKVDTYY